MPLTSTLQGYDPSWPDLYASEALRLTPVFGLALVEFHHIGSTAVPGLAAKPEIDMLALVTSSEMPESWATALATFGYTRGKDLAAGHHFFRKNVNGVRTHKLHVCVKGHQTAEKMLCFRDHLRGSPADRLNYEKLKLRLEAENTEGIGQYLEGKAPFIKSILDRIYQQ